MALLGSAMAMLGLGIAKLGSKIANFDFENVKKLSTDLIIRTCDKCF